MSRQGFASMEPEQQRAIAQKGGRANHATRFKTDDPRTSAAGKKGGARSGGRFKNGDPRARECGQKGGLARVGKAP